MSTNTSLPMFVEQRLRKIYETMALLDISIDSFKKEPIGNSTVYLRWFKEVKSGWEQHKPGEKSGENLSYAYTIINMSMQRLERRVRDLVKKYPPRALLAQRNEPQSEIIWFTVKPDSSRAVSPLKELCVVCHDLPKSFDKVSGQWREHCGRACANAAKFKSGMPLQSRCIRCNLNLKFVDPESGRIFKYCGSDCARLRPISLKQ